MTHNRDVMDINEGKIGAPFKWKHGRTKTIRVPVSLAEEVMRYAKELDKKGQVIVTQNSKASRSTSYGLTK